jgi:hypothetical protein
MKALVPGRTLGVSETGGVDIFVFTRSPFKRSLTEAFGLFVTTVLMRFKSRFVFGLLATP